VRWGVLPQDVPWGSAPAAGVCLSFTDF